MKSYSCQVAPAAMMRYTNCFNVYACRDCCENENLAIKSIQLLFFFILSDVWLFSSFKLIASTY